ncbi:MAG TPA: hypothetical protein VLI46_04615, partial [Ramlibacter sp.]|nr:hypothetical protein [Ramlibacter sp.]
MTQRAAVMGWRDRLAMVVSRPAVLALLGGLIFLAVFQWRYASINPDLYRYRDDGVITLSHAKNLIDFGFIGVNPSGERVEGFSAPLQFLVYALVYAVSGLGFTGFADLQTAAATFALGAMFVLFFAGRPVFALAACAVAAVVLTALASFMIWHGSGMENALTHVALLGTVFVLYDFARKGRVDRRWVVVPFLASITRLEGIYHVAPLIVVFCLYWHGARKDRAARD